MEFLRKYNAATHVYIPIVKRGVVDLAVSADWTPAAGDVKISKDGGAAANVTNLPAAITMGNAAYWDFSLTSTEMQAAKVVVTVADSATKAVEDQCFLVVTYGNASAEYPPDFSDATALGLSRLDAAISSRASQTSLDAVDDYVDTEVAAIKAKTDNLPASPAASSDCINAAGIRSAVGLASANLDTQLGAIAGYVDTEVAAILAAVDTEVAAIKARTDNLPASPAATSDIPTASANAAAVMAAAVEGVETLVETIRLLRSALVGKSDGFPAGPAHFRDRADTKSRITATVDADGNRTVVATDAT